MLLYYITDRRAFAGSEDKQRQAVLGCIAEAAAAGVDYIQLREKDLCARELEQLAKEAVAAVRAHSLSTRLLMNGRVDVALACGAGGVHLPGGFLSASEVRAIWMRASDLTPVIGVSAHSVEEAVSAAEQEADFAVLAPIFEKPGTQLPGLGPRALEAAHDRLSSFPVLALGGVTLANAAQCLYAGAAGVAGIRLFQEGDLHATVRCLRELNGFT